MNLTHSPHWPDIISFDLHFEASWALLLQALEILFTLIFVKKSSAKSLDILSIHITGVTQCVKIMFFEDTDLDLPTLVGSGTPKILGVVIFKTSLKIFGEFRSK